MLLLESQNVLLPVPQAIFTMKDLHWVLGNTNTDVFFLPNKLSVGDRVSERKCIRLKVLWMIISGHCAPSKQQRLDPAVQHFDMTLSALELATDLCKKNFVESL